jgi:hypothetical protein
MIAPETLKECHSIVWRYRTELEPYWPTPTVEDALLFALTELGEAVDAHLRTKPEYARNNTKELSELDELADFALMLLTAMGKDYVIGWQGDFSPYRGMHDWFDYVTKFYMATGWRGIDWAYTEVLVLCVATHPGMDLPTRLTARLEAIKAKRMPTEAM